MLQVDHGKKHPLAAALLFVLVAALVAVAGCTAPGSGDNNNNQKETVDTPTFSPGAGTYTSAQSVAINCGTAGAVIHYTLDGSMPTSSSATFNSALGISATTTVKAIAVKSDMNDSAVATATYTINLPPAHGYGDTAVTNAVTAYTQASSAAALTSNSSASAYYTVVGLVYTYHFNNYAASNGINVSGSVAVDISASSIVGTVTFSTGAVSSLVFNTAGSSGTEVFHFTDGTNWTYYLGTGTFVQT